MKGIKYIGIQTMINPKFGLIEVAPLSYLK